MTSPSGIIDRPLRLGSVQLKTPFAQAALSGYSDWPMRHLARTFGASYTVAEVMIDRFAREAKGTRFTGRHFTVFEGDHPVGAQLMGADPEGFGPAAQRLVAAGFDVIDINFGCPVRSALGGCRGGYHLSQPETACEIIARVRDAVAPEIPVTLKMRRGIDDSRESRRKFFTILDRAFDIGVAAVTVHGRTVVQKYDGPSRWGFLREVKESVGENVILGSGDLFSATDCVRMIKETGVDGVTIARGAIGNPWIFAQAIAIWTGLPLPDPPTVFEQRRVIEEHLALVRQTYGAPRSLGVIRKFAFKYARLHPQAGALKIALGQVKTPADWNAVLTEFYAHDIPGQFPNVDEVQTPRKSPR